MKFDTIYQIETTSEYRFKMALAMDYQTHEVARPVPAIQRIVSRVPNQPPRLLDLSK